MLVRAGYFFTEKFKYNYDIIIPMEIIVKPRKWGNSIGITIPKEILDIKNITLKDKLRINIEKDQDIHSIRGLIKFKKSAQQLKDEMREGWE